MGLTCPLPTPVSERSLLGLSQPLQTGQKGSRKLARNHFYFIFPLVGKHLVDYSTKTGPSMGKARCVAVLFFAGHGNAALRGPPHGPQGQTLCCPQGLWMTKRVQWLLQKKHRVNKWNRPEHLKRTEGQSQGPQSKNSSEEASWKQPCSVGKQADLQDGENAPSKLA